MRISKIPVCRSGRKHQISKIFIWLLIAGFLFSAVRVDRLVYAQEENAQDQGDSVKTDIYTSGQQPFSGSPDIETARPSDEVRSQAAMVDNLGVSQNVSLDFKDADIRNVLKIISYKSGTNIVATPEVIGNISIRLVEVPWEKALDIILKTYGFGYEKQGNIILVAPIDKLTAQKKQEVELAQVQPTITEVFNLRYLDAQDAKKALDPQLSARGKITVLEMTGQAGWEFGSQESGKRKRSSEERMGRSKILIVSDIPPVIDKVKEVISRIDIKPQQILISAKLVEVNKDKLRDIGFDYATGQAGAESAAVVGNSVARNNAGRTTQTLGGHSLGSLAQPSGFNPMSSAITGINPYNTGFQLIYKKLTGSQFEVIIHALEEDVSTNVLSEPRIMALNNQEATILVNTRYPILKEDTTTSGSTPVTTTTLDYYQDIGVQLNVVPQIAGEDSINMVIHPAVTSYTDTLGTNQYPIIQSREAETRILMNDGETIVIGGLIKDVKTKSVMGIPFLKDLPYVGGMFRRDTYDTQKVELLVFITAKIVSDSELSYSPSANLQDNNKWRAFSQPGKDKVSGDNK